MNTPRLKACHRRQVLRRAYQAYGSDADLTQLGCSVYGKGGPDNTPDKPTT